MRTQDGLLENSIHEVLLTETIHTVHLCAPSQGPNFTLTNVG
jgi:hypothetical protein